MSESILTVNLCRYFGHVIALEDVNIKVNKGEIFGLLGPNGSGKTTLIRILSTALLPSKGDAYVLGYDVKKDFLKIRKYINVVSGDEKAGYGVLTVKENLWFFSQLYGYSRAEGWKIVNELIEKFGMTRLDLLKQNAPIVRDVASQVAKYAPNSIVITVTNPMDVMTYVTYKVTGFPRERVIGMGGQLDSARYREILANMFNVSRNSVKALVIGEHGENMLPLARFSYIGGLRASDILTEDKIKEAEESTRKIAAEVIALKGATVFAPISCIASLIEAIVKDTKEIIPASVYLNGEYGLTDICIGVPIVVGRKGVEKIIELNLNEEEKLRFYKGAETIKNAINEIKASAII
jgi:malate dehydrogenase